MSTSTLRIMWPFFGLAAAIAGGWLANQLAERLLEPAPESVTTAAITHSKPGRPKPAKNKSARAAEAALIMQLGAVPEVGLLDGIGKEERTQLEKELGSENAIEEESPRSAALAMVTRARQELGAPVRSEKGCRLEPGRAALMARLSIKLRRRGFASLPWPGSARSMDTEAVSEYPPRTVQLEQRSRFSAVPTFMQMLQPEEEPIRILLVRTVAYLEDAMAAPALARLAVFESSPQVRGLAALFLAEKPPEQYRHVLLDAFRYPWAPAADHAADALIALEDREAVPALRQLLNEPDPLAPAIQEGRPVVRELVRVNHLKNCLLCHAPSMSESDYLRGPVPSPHEPLPAQYYQGQRPSAGSIFVRADITYLRQDFSVVLRVKNARPWPEMQRFDFLVRTRPATAEELAAQKGKIARSPQREAILHALDGLK